MVNREVIDVSIEDAIARYQAVELDGALVRTARGLGICLGDWTEPCGGVLEERPMADEDKGRRSLALRPGGLSEPRRLPTPVFLLQDRYDCNVPLLLFAAWAGAERGVALTAEEIAAAGNAVGPMAWRGRGALAGGAAPAEAWPAPRP